MFWIAPSEMDTTAMLDERPAEKNLSPLNLKSQLSVWRNR